MKLSRLAKFFIGGSKGVLALLVASGLLAGFASIGLLAVINRLLHRPHSLAQPLALAFIGLALLKVLTNVVSQILLVYLTQDAILDLVLKLCRQVTTTSLRTLERKGQPAVLTTLTDDTSALAWALQCIPNLIINAAVLVGGAAYLAWLSWPLFAVVVVLAMLGAGGYAVLYRRAFNVIYAARERRTVLFRHFRSLTEGIKELMMHRERRDTFLAQDVTETAWTLRRLNLEATKQYMLVDSSTQVSFYALIGAVLLVLPRILTVPPESITGYVFTILYLMSPMWGIINALPTLARGRVALEQIEELGLSLEPREGRAAAGPPPAHCCVPIEMQGVTFAYDNGTRGGGFKLGPIDFSLAPGEVVFVVGGNGSGKSTFVKLLTGLYRPEAGALRLGAQPIDDADRDWYRQHFAVVFSDFYLFDKLFGLPPEALERKAQAYLQRLRIAGKVQLAGERFSTIDLSQGQRRRLALLTAYLEDRPFYVFDEWAADQDPEYKDVFYTELLPELRARGKGVAVITHDDRYFHLGDRIIKLDEGRIVSTWTGPLEARPRLGALAGRS